LPFNVVLEVLADAKAHEKEERATRIEKSMTKP